MTWVTPFIYLFSLKNQNLCFVVPPAVYPDFKKQAYSPAIDTFGAVTQYVLEMPLEGLTVENPVIQLPRAPKAKKQAPTTHLDPQTHCMAPTAKNKLCSKPKNSCPVPWHALFRRRAAKRKAEECDSDEDMIEVDSAKGDEEDADEEDEDEGDEDEEDSDGYQSEFLTA
jgi:hypothetical protein